MVVSEYVLYGVSDELSAGAPAADGCKEHRRCAHSGPLLRFGSISTSQLARIASQLGASFDHA